MTSPRRGHAPDSTRRRRSRSRAHVEALRPPAPSSRIPSISARSTFRTPSAVTVPTHGSSASRRSWLAPVRRAPSARRGNPRARRRGRHRTCPAAHPSAEREADPYQPSAPCRARRRAASRRTAPESPRALPPPGTLAGRDARLRRAAAVGNAEEGPLGIEHAEDARDPEECPWRRLGQRCRGVHTRSVAAVERRAAVSSGAGPPTPSGRRRALCRTRRRRRRSVQGLPCERVSRGQGKPPSRPP